MNDTVPSTSAPVSTDRADWALMGMRWLLSVGLLLLNRLATLSDSSRDTIQYLLIAYLILTLFEAFFLWRRWGRQVWPQLTLALDGGVILALLFLSGGSASALLPLYLLPIVAISMRLGFSNGLGLNLAAYAGYALLVTWDYLSPNPNPALLKMGLFGAAMVIVGIFGGLIAEQLAQPSKTAVRQHSQELASLRNQHAAAHKRAQAFYEMSHTLSVTMSYQKVVEGILGQCQRLLDFSTGVVLLSAGTEDLFIAASAGLRVGDTEKQVHLVGGLLSQSLAAAEPQLIESLGRDPELGQIRALHRCRSGMCVPLRAGFRNYGAIIVGSINENAYGRSDLDQLVGLAHFATIAIQNAQLYQDLREERDKIIRAEENVRKELSRDLHDGPAQTLAAIAMNIDFIKRLLIEEPAKVVEELNSLERLARKTSWDIRTMLFELRPVILETQGIVPTLEQYVQRFPASEGLAVHLDTAGFDLQLPPKVQTTVFTIMQEAVNNARKHAKAKNLWLRLKKENNNLVASVQDDGIGFNVDAIQSSYDQRGSFGLLNMQERAQLVGGRTEIRSTPGKGSAVIITVPLDQE